MNRRVVVRVALAALALYGCAQVLGIDDLPVPDAPDGGSEDGAAHEASLTDDGRSPFDVIAAPPADAALDAGTEGDVKLPFIAIQPEGPFDPSSVVWDPELDTLYVADNAFRMGGPSNTSGSLRAFPDAGGDGTVLVALDLPGGERFGQISEVPGEGIWILPTHASPDAGRVYEVTVDGSGRPTLTSTITSPSGPYYGSAILGAKVPQQQQVFLTALKPNTRLLSSKGLGGTPVTFLVVDGGSVAVACTTNDTVTVVTADAKLVRYTIAGMTAATVANDVADAGYIAAGPDGGYLVGTGAFIRWLTADGRTVMSFGRRQDDGGYNDPFDHVGAFFYDADSRRIFVPEGAHESQQGRIVIFTLPVPQ